MAPFQLTVSVLLGFAVAVATVAAISSSVEIDGLEVRNQLISPSALDVSMMTLLIILIRCFD